MGSTAQGRSERAGKRVPTGLIPKALTIKEDDFQRAVSSFGTPLYLYDHSLLEDSYRGLEALLPPKTRIFYSVKSNPAKRVIESFNELGAAMEISSAGEFEALVSANCQVEEATWVGPGKTREELSLAVDRGVGQIVVESPGEYRRLRDICKGSGKSANVLLRINPGYGKGALSMSGTTQFGMDLEDAEALIRESASEETLDIRGIHGFLGTRVLDDEVLVDNISKILGCAEFLQKRSGKRFSFVDVGGGFGVPLYEGETPLDAAGVKKALGDLFDSYLDKHPWSGTLAVESGRYLAAEAGVLLLRIVDVKEVGGERFAIADGGINVIGGRDGYLGAKATPMEILGAKEREEERVTICGPLCTPADRLAVGVSMPKVREGDLLAIYLAGAYGPTASPGLFLGRGFPVEALWRNGEFLKS